MFNLELLDKLLKKEMSRKDFLKHMAAFVVSMIGISTIIKNLANPMAKPKPSKSTAQKRNNSFGGGSYGG